MFNYNRSLTCLLGSAPQQERRRKLQRRPLPDPFRPNLHPGAQCMCMLSCVALIYESRMPLTKCLLVVVTFCLLRASFSA